MNNWESQRLVGLYNRKGRGIKSTFILEQKQQIQEWLKKSEKDWKKVLEKIQKEWEITVSKDTNKRIFTILLMKLQKCDVLNQALLCKNQKIQDKIIEGQEKNLEIIGVSSYFTHIKFIKIIKVLIKYESIKIYNYSSWENLVQYGEKVLGESGKKYTINFA